MVMSTVPVTVIDVLLVSVPLDGEVMVIPGLLGLTSTVTVGDVAELLAPSTALT